jgi:N-acetyl-gamma-glutamylphosphate reductase
MAIPSKTLQNHKPLKTREKKHKEEETKAHTQVKKPKSTNTSLIAMSQGILTRTMLKVEECTRTEYLKATTV